MFLLAFASTSEFNSSYEEVLRNTVIADETPGTILHDFQVMLDFVTEGAPQLTNTHLLPMKVLQPLNERLMCRIEQGLTRPQQKSYPHINGLFLLLRATGLTLVDRTGRKPVLEVDPAVENSWRTLNPDERYFTLLESWLMRGDREIVGERVGRFDFEHPLRLWSEFFQRLDRQTWYDGSWLERIRYWPGPLNLALMELFGLVAVDAAPAEPRKGWQIDDIRATEWGEALLVLLSSQLADNLAFWEKLSQPQDISSGELQPFLQPYRPKWQHVLQLPDETFQEGLFIFKVSLDKDLWRRIIIPAESTLEDLSDAILDAYNFDHDHLYRFLYPTRFGLTSEAYHPYMDYTGGAPTTDEVRIGDLPAQPGFQMVYNFDFGDNWLFDVLLERIDPPKANASRYRIGKRQGRSPKQYPIWE